MPPRATVILVIFFAFPAVQCTIGCAETRAIGLVLIRYFQIRKVIEIAKTYHVTYANEHGHAKHVAYDLQNVFVLRCPARANNSVRDLQAQFLTMEQHGQELTLDDSTRVVFIAGKVVNLFVVRVKIMTSGLHSRRDFCVLKGR